MQEFSSIPKTGYHFIAQQFFPEKFKRETQQVFENLTPVTCVFAYYGNIQASWVDHLKLWIQDNKPNPSLTPDFIVVNKKGMIYKVVKKAGDNKLTFTYNFIDFAVTQYPGDAFSRILNELYNLSNEELYMQPDYTHYFNNDF
jgi:hypothetical protein